MRSTSRLKNLGGAIALVVSCTATGCAARQCASVTAVPLSPWNQCEPEGIPYYLPKPLLVVSKNVRHIDEAKVGLTDPVPIPNAFDNQAAYGDLKANVTVPGTTSTAAANTGTATPGSAFDTGRSTVPTAELSEKMIPGGRMEDGIAPDSFYTYQIIFVPDLSQKYGLRITGGPGEIRAAMNLVNGWMYTGMGPFYLKDSSTAQDIMSCGVAAMFAGRGAADVLNEVGDLARIAAGDPGTPNRAPADTMLLAQKFDMLKRLIAMQNPVPKKIENYAEVHIYEPTLTPDGKTAWTLIASHSFDRQYFSPQVDAKQMEMFMQMLNFGPPTGPKVNEGPVAPAPTPAGAPSEMPHEDVRSPALMAPASATFGGGKAAPALRTAFNQSGSTGTTSSIQGFVPKGATMADTTTSHVASAPGQANAPTDLLFDDLERSKLGLPPAGQTASTPATSVNVHVEAGDRDYDDCRPAKVAKARPKNQSRTTRLRSFLPAATAGAGGAGGPGADVRN